MSRATPLPLSTSSASVSLFFPLSCCFSYYASNDLVIIGEKTILCGKKIIHGHKKSTYSSVKLLLPEHLIIWCHIYYQNETHTKLNLQRLACVWSIYSNQFCIQKHNRAHKNMHRSA